MDFRIIIYIFFGILPSLAWLFYYLRKDVHPEPKSMVLSVFLWGALITVPVFFVQIGAVNLLEKINLNPAAYSLIYWFLVISFSEEIFKYFVIKIRVMKSPHLDEPTDIVLYMIIAALGFAALENTLYLFTPDPLPFNDLLNRSLVISIVRFLGSTFLHTLCSAVIGYSLAISFNNAKKRRLIIVGGIIMATLLHGFFDFSIMTLDGYLKFVMPIVTLITLAFFVFSGFKNLQKMKSVCKLN